MSIVLDGPSPYIAEKSSNTVVNRAESSRNRRADKIEFRYSPAFVSSAIAATDSLCFVAAALIVSVMRLGADFEALSVAAIEAGAAIALYGLIASRAGFHSLGVILSPLSRLDGVFLTVAKVAALFIAASFAFGATAVHPPLWSLAFAGTAFVLIAASRFAARRAVLALNRRGVVGNTMVVLGGGDRARNFLARFHRANPLLSSIAGVFTLDGESKGRTLLGHPVLGGLDDLMDLARRQKIDDIVVAMPWSSEPYMAEVIAALKELPVNVHLSTEIEAFDLIPDPSPGSSVACPMFAVAKRPITGPSLALKTAQDLVLASLALLALSPLLVLIALAIKIDSPGPVFFMQKRLGFNNKPFEIFKFRSMYHNRPDDDGHVVQQATRNDPRVTRVGRFIRATSLDELPQFLNVLNGTMSLVGPRPHALSHNEEYGRVIRGYFARHRVKPGITGWAQVKGLRGETEDLRLMEARVEHDVYYADNWSMMLDFKILLMTVIVVLFQRTAY